MKIKYRFILIDHTVSKGDGIAQLIIERIRTPDVIEVTKLSETKRGEGGYGSTNENNVPVKQSYFYSNSAMGEVFECHHLVNVFVFIAVLLFLLSWYTPERQ